MQTEIEKLIDETKVGKHTITISRRFESDGYDALYQAFVVRVNGKFFDKRVTGNLCETYLPKDALDIFKDAKIAARSC